MEVYIVGGLQILKSEWMLIMVLLLVVLSIRKVVGLLVYYESFRQKQEAQSREYAIKRLNKAQKLRLIASATMDTLENINLSE